jgi:hypothetical protein
VVEPAGADRGVHLGRIPDQLVEAALECSAAAQVLVVAADEPRELSVVHALRLLGDLLGVAEGGGDDAPLVAPGVPGFVPAPAHVGSAHADHGSRLQAADDLVIALPVVRLHTPVGALSVGAVEPDREHVAVPGEQLGELRDEEVVVGATRAVGRLRPVPGREVDPEPQAVAASRVGDLGDEIAPAAAPGRGGDRVLGHGARPEAEPVVVLGGEDHPRHPGADDRTHPLVDVDGVGVEQCRVLVAEPPLAVGHRGHPEVEERVELERLPVQLPLFGPHRRQLLHVVGPRVDRHIHSLVFVLSDDKRWRA